MHHRTLVLSGLLAGTLLLGACGDGATNTAGSAPERASASASAQADFQDADVAFATGMKAHHEQAVEMSDLVLDAEPTPEVAALAERIKADQEPEIRQLEQMLDHFGVEASSGEGGHAGHGSGDGAQGMMTDEQMDRLREARGQQASVLFLELMVEHHRGALAEAEAELDAGTYPPAREMAEKIRRSQAEEIREMQELLRRL
jgi:uncharacterized protein (DUF305 family)